MTGTPTLPILWTAEDAAAATGGQATGTPWQATGVSIDSRTVKPGDLFIAIKGPTFDGHAFAAQALDKGAAAAMVSDVPPGVAGDAPLLAVDDTMAAMTDLGRMSRMRTRARVIGVTGSVGKTGTKEALRHVLSAQAPTFATEGSLNNHWGVPLSLARMPPDSAYAVFEMGMNHAGELGPLSRLVHPQVAIITTVEPAHMEFFASVEAIADAKAEIFEGMEPGGVAVLNRDNPHYARLLAAARTQGLKVRSFGTHGEADARLLSADLGPDDSRVSTRIGDEAVDYTIALPGRHWVMNSLAVLLAVSAAGGDVAAAALAFATLPAVKGRGVRRRIDTPSGAFTLIDESYNASPAAMEAAFAVLGRLAPAGAGRRVAVLGDMREMGSKADSLHIGLAPALLAAGVGTVYCCGPHMRALFDTLPAAVRGGWTEDSAALAPLVAGRITAGDVVLVKGSAGSRMGRVVEALGALSIPTNDNPSPPPAAASGQRG